MIRRRSIMRPALVWFGDMLNYAARCYDDWLWQTPRREPIEHFEADEQAAAQMWVPDYARERATASMLGCEAAAIAGIVMIAGCTLIVASMFDGMWSWGEMIAEAYK